MERGNGKRILVLGGTGAMGVYLVPELLAQGYHVDVVSLDAVRSESPQLTYRQANAMDDALLAELLRPGYDAIVDFMIYRTDAFRARHERLLGSTEHYLYLSSYRVYAKTDRPITEDAPQLLDVSTDEAFLASDDYALAKARQEDILEASRSGNYTILRPAITYSKRRYQLVTLEANTLIARARRQTPVILPQEALDRQATMSWAGDVAAMMARLVLNPLAYGESYTVSTAEHHSWREVAACYQELIGLEIVPVDAPTYLRLIGGGDSAAAASLRDETGVDVTYWPMKWQLDYDRLFDRVVDNSKVLAATGMRQADLAPLIEGLRRELAALPPDAAWPDPGRVNERMDAFLRERVSVR